MRKIYFFNYLFDRFKITSKKWTFSLFTMLSIFLMQAQTTTISGTIVDETNQPLVGANVLVKGTTNGAVADFDGNYSVSASQGDVLVISFTGFETKEVTVGANSTINVSLVEDAQSLDEVVVIGYGTRKKTDVVSAVSTVDKDFLEQQPSSDATRALQGSASGVTVLSSARPGQQAQVRIRGIGSINGNNPLYIVDGVQGGTVPPPDQIESMQVLKDASSTAIYGARGASGVILITTKSGRRNQAATIQFNVKTGIGKTNAKYDLVTDPTLIGQMLWLEQTNDGITPSHPHFQFDPNDIQGTRVNDYLFPNGASFGDASTDPSLYQERDYPITVTNQNGTDWLDEIYETAPLLQEYSLVVNGGSEKTTYAFNGNFFSEEGIFKYNDFKRYAFRSNIDSEINDWLTIGQRIGATLSESRGNTVGFSEIVETSPLIPVYDIAGNFAGGIVGGGLNDGPNPLGNNFRERKDLRKTLNLQGNFYIEIKPLKNIKFKSLFGYNMNWFSNHDPRFADPENTNGSFTNTLSEIRSNSLNWNFTNTLNYNKTFSDVHNLDVILGMESVKLDFDEIRGGRAGYISTEDDFYYLTAGAGAITNNSRAWTWSMFSLFGRAFYSYDDKYIVEGTVRRDGSSRFGANNRYGVFPAASVGWVVTKENFMEGSSNWLRQLKFRAGWGQSGNDQIGNYNGFTTFGSGLGNSYYGITGGDNTIALGYQSTAFGNPDAKWETTESLNVGFDVTIAGGLDFSLDWWTKTTEDMLFRTAIPDVEGQAQAPFVNVGTMENQGVDFEVNYRGAVGQDFTYNLGLNASWYNNEVTKLSSEDGDALIGRSERGQTYTRAETGRAFPEFYGYIVDGIFQTPAEADAHATNGDYNQPGNYKFRDVSGPDGVPDGEITPDDRTWIGNPHPDFTAGLNIGLQYKNFDLTAIWYASVGNDLINYHNRFTRYGLFQGPKAADRLFRSWGSPYLDDNANAVLPKASSTTSQEQNTNSTMIEDGSFLRLKSLQIGYNLPSKVLDKMGLSSLRLYVTGTNLVTLFNDYSGLDVEILPRNDPNTGNAEINRGFDFGTWPQPKQFIFGLNISM
ncbi:TonB-dependent receptor [uncultured Algibacter sp.]|uniref:SusC/RagA family TonB-linked outer membrane protein n=1 Tax=uncultured Algibacter sp. TaxID=298659 RepID=UPI002619E3C7|nr:TonB-dependent receptor [uncultured Algibacter sp.]